MRRDPYEGLIGWPYRYESWPQETWTWPGPTGHTYVIRENLAQALRDSWDDSQVPVIVGGDHGLLHPVREAHLGYGEGGLPALLVLDAHLDLWTPGSPDNTDVLREWAYRAPVIALGVRDYQFLDEASDLGIVTITADQVEQEGVEQALSPWLGVLAASGLHLSIDADVLDPSIHPNVESQVPGGLTVREVRRTMTLVEDFTLYGLDLAESLGHPVDEHLVEWMCGLAERASVDFAQDALS